MLSDARLHATETCTLVLHQGLQARDRHFASLRCQKALDLVGDGFEANLQPLAWDGERLSDVRAVGRDWLD